MLLKARLVLRQLAQFLKAPQSVRVVFMPPPFLRMIFCWGVPMIARAPTVVKQCLFVEQRCMYRHNPYRTAENERVTSDLVDMAHDQRKEVSSLMERITRDMPFRCSRMVYRKDDGASGASRKDNRSRSFIDFRKKRSDGMPEPPACGFCKLIRPMRPLGWAALRDRLDRYPAYDV